MILLLDEEEKVEKLSSMSALSQAVSLHPYFNVQEGRLADFVEVMGRFVERTADEPACLYYDFSISGQTVFCREAYVGAAGIVAHLENVGDLIGEVLGYSELARLEVHGPAAEIEKLREPMAELEPVFFVRECGLAK